jgi:hypothetical protein
MPVRFSLPRLTLISFQASVENRPRLLRVALKSGTGIESSGFQGTIVTSSCFSLIAVRLETQKAPTKPQKSSAVGDASASNTLITRTFTLAFRE